MNTSRILREIWLAKSISRVEISARLGLNKSTVSNIVRELIDQGVIVLSDEGSPGPKGGRKPVLLTMNRKYGYVLGFEFRPESYTAVAVDLEGEILFYKSERIRIKGEDFVSTFFEILSRVEEESLRLGQPLLGIGLGVSGIVNPEENRIISSILLEFVEEFDFQNEITPNLGVPLFVDNDANCCAWGELAFLREQNLNNFLFVLVEFRDDDGLDDSQDRISVGLGMVINGTVHYGDGYLSGEFRSILKEKSQKGQFAIESESLQNLEKNDLLLDRFFMELSKNIALLANAFNLSQIFLGGDIEKYHSRITEIMQKEIGMNWPYQFSVTREIRFSSLGDKSVAFGAAGMVLNRLLVDFDPERGTESRFPLDIMQRVMTG